jgi:3'(2'), 5'-bisphosphate nucleotidase
MSGLLDHPLALCNTIRRIALEAGALTMEYFEPGAHLDISCKSDGSPVTAADRLAEALIEKALADLAPGVPFVGEEACAEGRIPDLDGAADFWLVDPLDGTRDFIAGSPDYTVNIALIRGGVPTLGVIYAPAHGKLYAACGPGTALRWHESTQAERPLRVRSAPAGGLTVLTSHARADAGRMESFLDRYKISRILRSGSSLKLCSIAAGKADLYPRFGPTCEWDTAAGQAILHAAGGQLARMDGTPLVYGRAREGFLNPAFVASSGDIPGIFDPRDAHDG